MGTFKKYITHRGGRGVYGPCDNSVTGEGGGQLAIVTIFLVTPKKSRPGIHVTVTKWWLNLLNSQRLLQFFIQSLMCPYHAEKNLRNPRYRCTKYVMKNVAAETVVLKSCCISAWEQKVPEKGNIIIFLPFTCHDIVASCLSMSVLILLSFKYAFSVYNTSCLGWFRLFNMWMYM